MLIRYKHLKILLLVLTLVICSVVVQVPAQAFAQNFTAILTGCCCSGSTQHRYYAYNFVLNGTTVTFQNSHPSTGGTVHTTSTTSRYVVVSSVYPDSAGQGAPVDSSVQVSGSEGGTCYLRNLDTRKQYYIYTVAISGNTTWLDGDVWSTPLYCQAPDITVTSHGLSPNYPIVSWPAVDGAASYKVECATDANFTQNKLSYTTTSTTCELIGSSWDTVYFVRAMTVAPAGSVDSAWTTKNIQVLSKKTTPVDKPPVTSTDITQFEATLNVSAVAHGDIYEVQYSSSPSYAGATTQTIIPGTIPLTDLSANTTYYVRVRAASNDEHYATSEWFEHSFKTLKIPLDAPSIEAIQVLDSGSVKLEISEVLHATTYIIEYSTSSNFSTYQIITV